MARTKKTVEETTATEGNATPRAVYRAADVGKSGSKTYAFHVEGNLTRDPELRPASDKGSMLLISIGIGMGAHALMAKAKGEAVEEDPEDKPFVSLVLYDKLADSLSVDGKKGEKIAVCGEMKEYPNKNGEKNVEIVVDNYTLLPREDGTMNTRLTTVTRSFKTKAGEEKSNATVTLLTGKVVGLHPLETDHNGNPLLRCGLKTVKIPAEKIADVALRGKAQESYEDDAKNIVNLAFFGVDAERKSKLIRDGMKISVTGRVGESDNEGKTYVSVYPQVISVIEWPANEAGTASAPAAAPSTANGDSFTEIGGEVDDLPF